MHFAVWAPNARRVSVVGDFNGWDGRVHPMRALRARPATGRSSCPDLGVGDRYKFEVVGADGQTVLKADPCGRYFETPPLTASIVWNSDGYAWGDEEWMAARRARRTGGCSAPMSVYEVHLGSWRRSPDGRLLTYRELADDARALREGHGLHAHRAAAGDGASVHRLVGLSGDRVLRADQPLRHAGGFQVLRRRLSSRRHRRDPRLGARATFPKDQHGLARFDGTALYEHADPRQGEHQDWGTLVFNYGRHEVRSFLLSNALFWIEQFHIDGLRVDAVASMLYLDYSRKAGEWVPNQFGGRENLEAIEFLKQLNMLVGAECPGRRADRRRVDVVAGRDAGRCISAASGSPTSGTWAGCTTCSTTCKQDPVHRKCHHNKITFSLLYAFSENFVLPFSHDEVVHGKGSMLDKMPGDVWQKHANLRALYGYMFTHPGKKLLFMGGEIGQWREWNHDGELDWEVLGDPRARRAAALGARPQSRLRRASRRCGRSTSSRAASRGSIATTTSTASSRSLRPRPTTPTTRRGRVVNFTPVPRRGYRIGVPRAGAYREVLNSDAESTAAATSATRAGSRTEPKPSHGFEQSLTLTRPAARIPALET